MEHSALNERLGNILGVEALAERVAPGPWQHPPLSISAFALDVAKPVRHRSAVCSQVGRIESGVAVPFEDATDLIDGGADFGRIVPTTGNVPSAEDTRRSFIDRAGRPRKDSELNGELARDRNES